MSNNLSENMRRSEINRKDETRRAELRELRQSLVSRVRNHNVVVTELLDEFAKSHGHSKEQMVQILKNARVGNIVEFYEHNSQAISTDYVRLW